MATVWERTQAFLSEHVPAILAVALPLMVLPAIVDAVVQAWAAQPVVADGGRLAASVVSLAVVLIGQLGWAALTALVLEPRGARAAIAWGARRFGAVIGVSLALLAGFGLLLLPLIAALAADGVNQQSLAAGAPPQLSGLSVALLIAYLLVGLPLLVWVATRLSIVTAVVVGERRGLGAIRHGFALTRGLAARLLGAFLLIGLVGGIAVLALRLIVGTILRLAIAQGDGIDVAALMTAIVAALGGAALEVVFTIFVALLYVTLRGRLATPPAAA